MNNLNSTLIEGNMVRDPLYRTTPNGRPVCKFSLASNRYRKQESGFEEEVSFFDIEAWATLAESCNNQGRKGRGVRVVGRLKQDRWTDTEGKNRSKVFIIAEHIEFRPDFRQDSAMEMHAKAISGRALAEAAASVNSADYETDTSARSYLDEELTAEYEDNQAVPASVVF
ncbi:MAG: single-stranded DNA-binding protein [Treponema sp.]|nr:single-stranded DNA-binding protein [Treponema sp.]